MKTYDLVPKEYKAPKVTQVRVKVKDIENDIIRMLIMRNNPTLKEVTMIKRVDER